MKQVICLLFIVFLFCQLYALANAAPQGIILEGPNPTQVPDPENKNEDADGTNQHVGADQRLNITMNIAPGMVNDDRTIESTKRSSLVETDHFTNKVALVTGASSGIGKAIVQDLIRKGMRVVALARRIDIIEI